MIQARCTKCRKTFERVNGKHYCPNCRSIMLKEQKLNRSVEIESFYASKEWKQCKAIVKRKTKGLCYMCKVLADNAKGKYKIAEDYHHIKNLIDNWELRLDWNNIMPLCQYHHRKIVHAKRLNSKEEIDQWLEKEINRI